MFLSGNSFLGDWARVSYVRCDPGFRRDSPASRVLAETQQDRGPNTGLRMVFTRCSKVACVRKKKSFLALARKDSIWIVEGRLLGCWFVKIDVLDYTRIKVINRPHYGELPGIHHFLQWVH